MEKIRTKLIIYFILSLVWSTSCKDKIDPDSDIGEEVLETLPNVKIKGTEQFLRLNSDYIYDENVIRDYELLIKPSDLRKINDDPAKKEYVPAVIILEGDTLSDEVQVRFKGQIGSFIGCVSGPDWRNPSGFKTCAKLSMQVKMSSKNRKEKFYDLNRLQFHAQNLDRSQLREKLSYWLFREMGVPAPRSVHARLKINGKYQGVYGLTEEVDNRFAKYFYPDSKGSIYKEIWPLTDKGLSPSVDDFKNALRSNEEEGEVSFFKSISDDLQKSNLTEAKMWVSKYMDVNAIMAYIAVDRTIRLDDGPFHWYCDENGNNCKNKNFYWFEDTRHKKIHIVPWDMDDAFEHVLGNTNPVVPIADKWGQISNNCRGFATPGTTIRQKSAACDKLTAAWVLYKTEYDDARKKLKNNLLTEDQAIAKIDKWAALLSPYIKEADLHYNASELGFKATTQAQWRASIDTIKKQVRGAALID
jgi:spore coat protein CotH